MQQSDEEIVAKVKSGDSESFGVLVQRYEAKMARYGRRFLSDPSDIEDLVQEVFLKAYVNIQSFDVTRRFSPWLYRIAHNEFVNALKRKSRQPFSFFDFDTDIVFPHPIAAETADKEAHDRELRQALGASLDKIPDKYRESLVLYYVEELSYQDIAEVLRIPISTVGVRLQRGKEKLKKVYEGQYGKHE